MTLFGSTRDFVLFINEYFTRFAELVDGLSENGKPSERSAEFFTLHNIRVASEATELLHQQMDSPVLGMLQMGERVISFSFRSGGFDAQDFKLGIEKNQKEFIQALDTMKQKNGDSYANNEAFKRTIDLLQEFVRNNYRAATYAEIRDWFAIPLMYDISDMARKTWKKENVVKIEDFIVKRQEL